MFAHGSTLSHKSVTQPHLTRDAAHTPAVQTDEKGSLKSPSANASTSGCAPAAWQVVAELRRLREYEPPAASTRRWRPSGGAGGSTQRCTASPDDPPASVPAGCLDNSTCNLLKPLRLAPPTTWVIPAWMLPPVRTLPFQTREQQHESGHRRLCWSSLTFSRQQKRETFGLPAQAAASRGGGSGAGVPVPSCLIPGPSRRRCCFELRSSLTCGSKPSAPPLLGREVRSGPLNHRIRLSAPVFVHVPSAAPRPRRRTAPPPSSTAGQVFFS